MAEYIATTPFLSINAVEMTNWLRSAVTVERTADEVETSSAASNTKTYAAGLLTGRFRCTLKQSYESGGPDVTLRGLLGKTVTVVTRPKSTNSAADNPQQTFKVVVTSVPSPTGSLGELSELQVDWPITGAIAVAT